MEQLGRESQSSTILVSDPKGVKGNFGFRMSDFEFPGNNLEF